MFQDSNSVPNGHVFDLENLSSYFFEDASQPLVAVEGEACVIRHANSAFYRLSGAEQSGLIGRRLSEAVPEGEENGCDNLLDRVFHSGQPETLLDQRHGVGVSAYWSYASWPIMGANARPWGVIIQVTDSTHIGIFRDKVVAMNEALLLSSIRQQVLTEESKELSARLESAIETKEYFIAVLSHELRTPLTPLMLVSSMLQDDPALDEETRGFMQMIHRNITLEARLIDDLLDMTRMERGKLKLVCKIIDARDAVNRAIALASADLKAAQLTLELDAGDVPLPVDADADRLEQVFSNLLRNAIKFTPVGGTVSVRCVGNGINCVVSVTDTGAGMDAAFIPFAFLPFAQGDRLGNRKAGLGLGLAICKTIVDLHHGHITAHSAGKDNGTKFVVTLPVAATLPVGTVEGTLRGRGHAPGKRLQILLVEDHDDSAELLREILIDSGYVVEWARDVATGLKLANEQQFDLLLSDLGLPDGSGFDLMRSLRRGGFKVPGIVLSGHGQDQDIANGIAAGFAAHLVKPFSPQQLQNTIAAVMAT